VFNWCFALETVILSACLVSLPGAHRHAHTPIPPARPLPDPPTLRHSWGVGGEGNDPEGLSLHLTSQAMLILPGEKCVWGNLGGKSGFGVRPGFKSTSSLRLTHGIFLHCGVSSLSALLDSRGCHHHIHLVGAQKTAALSSASAITHIA
jgi:hypothetical protein